MKSEAEIRKQLETLEALCMKADSGSRKETILLSVIRLSVIDELEWVLR